MSLRIYRTPRFLHWIFPEQAWQIPATQHEVYLTFDDGPTPEITPWVLSELKRYHALATFFCIGANVTKHPEIYQQILNGGHATGNHTFNHLNGWKCKNDVYVSNVLQASELIQSTLFRPPYGRIGPFQSRILREKGYRIIMWTLLSFDFDPNLDRQECLKVLLKKIKPGSIIVFHDSEKAQKNIRYLLPKLLESLAEKQYQFKIIQ